MKSITTYITEKLRIDNPVEHKYFPQTKEELSEIIQDHIKNKIYDLNDIDVSSITDMNHVFAYLYIDYREDNIEIDVSSWDVSNVTNMEHMFLDTSKLKNIKGLENWDVSNVKTFAFMFYKCGCEELNLRNWKTDNVETLFCMFTNCKNLKKIHGIEDFNTSKVKTFHKTFMHCSSLKEMDLSSWDVSKCSNFSSMFRMMKSLKSLGNIDNWNIDFKNLKVDMQYMFHETKNIVLPKWAPFR